MGINIRSRPYTRGILVTASRCLGSLVFPPLFTITPTGSQDFGGRLMANYLAWSLFHDWTSGHLDRCVCFYRPNVADLRSRTGTLSMFSELVGSSQVFRHAP